MHGKQRELLAISN